MGDETALTILPPSDALAQTPEAGRRAGGERRSVLSSLPSPASGRGQSACLSSGAEPSPQGLLHVTAAAAAGHGSKMEAQPRPAAAGAALPTAEAPQPPSAISSDGEPENGSS
mmetsp:Transcript_18689/g.60040  ORF Transcript_18689/g.60040 Transcript_18689/m.60040 type:complete len:113 (-) Transcript_18689:258-596(-)